MSTLEGEVNLKSELPSGKQAINWTRLSCKGMAQNEDRLQLHALAYNRGVFLQGAGRASRPYNHIPAC